jgi:hypothetical protein
MKSLDVQSRLEYARAGVAVIRALSLAGAKISYGNFASAIGLISDGDKWQPWHRQQVRDLLDIIAVAEKTAGAKTGTQPTKFDVIVAVSTGEPGAGITKTSKIVRK